MKKRISYFIPSFTLKNKLFVLLIGCILFHSGCIHDTQLNVYQKNIPVPGYAWDYGFHPSFQIKITDTTAYYNIYVTVRHTSDYPYSNLWLLIYSNYTGVKPKSKR